MVPVFIMLVMCLQDFFFLSGGIGSDNGDVAPSLQLSVLKISNH